MTILELYEYAKEKDILNYDVEIENDSNGIHEGTRSIRPEEIRINDDWKEIIL